MIVASEIVRAKGHPNVTAKHKTTLEITRDWDLTVRGDCIIGVEADKAASDLSSDFKDALKSPGNILLVILEAGGFKDYLIAHGSRGITATDPRRIIIRRSSFIEPATIGVYATKAAGDLERGLVNSLKTGDAVLTVKLYVLRLEDIEPVNPRARGVF
uniref:DUF371 domain-containing protein n=1 Tax=Thermosphaera aggregans TaxID=54254 RepID=A0A7C2BK18_9CREN